MKINIIGGIFGNDGYSSHTRSLANAFYPLADCRISTQVNPGWEKLANDAEFEMITKPERKDDWNIIVAIPHTWKMLTGLGKNAAYCVWEGDKMPASWIEDMLNPKIDLILVPSNHTKEAIEETLQSNYFHNADEILDKIRVIPHGVDLKTFQKREVPREDKFVFVCNKGWRGTSWDRGGVQYLLKAFAEEFSKDEKVKLIVKLNPAYINPEFIQPSIQALNLDEDRAEIHILSDFLPKEKLCDLYNSADCFICATRGEAFNLPGLEAMACGLPTIQTNFGGQTDYMTNKNSLVIDYDLALSEEKPMYDDIQWAVPSVQSIREQLRKAFDHPESVKGMGLFAKETAQHFTWDASAKLILKAIKE